MSQTAKELPPDVRFGGVAGSFRRAAVKKLSGT